MYFAAFVLPLFLISPFFIRNFNSFSTVSSDTIGNRLLYALFCKNPVFCIYSIIFNCRAFNNKGLPPNRSLNFPSIDILSTFSLILESSIANPSVKYKPLGQISTVLLHALQAGIITRSIPVKILL